MKAIGVISGTSMDGIDVAAIETDGEERVKRLAGATYPYSQALRQELLVLIADPARCEHEALVELDARVTAEHAGAIKRFMREHGVSGVEIVGAHGQTILHRVERRFTRQLGQGAGFAAQLGIDTVTDFRKADVAAGGQGAPFVPLYHRALAAPLPKPVAVLNLGGVGNVTYIDDERTIAFDTGPANAMVDDWVLAKAGRPYDEGGAIAANGHVDEEALAQLMANSYFALPAPKSLDRNDFSPAPVAGLALADGAATLTAFTAASVAAGVAHLPSRPTRWLVTGGGRHNATLMAMLRRRLGVTVDPVEAVGWNGDTLEAEAFAYLAVRSLNGLPLSLPSTTGVPRPMPGGVLHRATRKAA